MPQTIMIDGFRDSAPEFYRLVQEQLKERDIPNVRISFVKEFGRKLGFLRREEVPCLQVGDGTRYEIVLAYEYGGSFCVSTRAFWKNARTAKKDRQGKLSWAEGIHAEMLSRVVDLAVKDALAECERSNVAEAMTDELQPEPASINGSSRVALAG